MNDNRGDHTTHMDTPGRTSILHTLPLNLTLLQVGGLCVTDGIGSERARQLLKATQLSHNRIEWRSFALQTTGCSHEEMVGKNPKE